MIWQRGLLGANVGKGKDWGWGRKLYFQTFVKLKMFEEILKYKTSWGYSNDKVCVSFLSVMDINR